MLENCVACGYSLNGLPDVHRCPECGREFERDSVVVRKPRDAAWGPWGAAAGAAAVKSWSMMSGGGNVDRMDVLVLASLTCLGVALWVRRPNVVVVSTRFLELIDRRSGSKVHPMAPVADARWNFVNGTTQILDCDGNILLTIPSEFLGSNRANKRVVAAIKSYVAKRNAAAPG